MDETAREIRKRFKTVPVKQIEVEREKPNYLSLQMDDVERMKEMCCYIRKILKGEDNKDKLKIFFNDDLTVRGIDREFVAAFISVLGGDNIRLLGVTEAMIDYVLSYCFGSMYKALQELGKTICDPYNPKVDTNKEGYSNLYGEDKLTAAISSNVEEIIARQAKAYETPSSVQMRKFFSSLSPALIK